MKFVFENLKDVHTGELVSIECKSEVEFLNLCASAGPAHQAGIDAAKMFKELMK